ncbi:ATP-binding protein [Burkholderia cenocepacia]|uniref:ATP-binding protein n=2 Tax=Burkholderia cenocepacia TaxID=95486 RepID=UPI0020A0622E|nr:ATP-binding protein [Burkholderia cenocepacia]MCO8402787.1 ATP-binding protein [Burkholderia cenocepacia]MCO8415026.1 ATP-binding protein [Burkholderia cenocepacia]MCO8482047.1 ATP-binding protein [Burkholderia cenocepacia]MCO8511193.1 ATP-binding protein [Burkholderia cenocepacia]MCO8541149.1 ATP-binding protein [Burkholderia cenocepacia]
MKHAIIRRPEMDTASLDLGGEAIDLADYATTGLLGVAVGPRGGGKTNAGLVIAEQLAQQGWVCVLVDPEAEMEALYGDAVPDAEALRRTLVARNKPFVVVRAEDAVDFIPYGRAILDVADAHRKPIFVMIDEGQLFSAARKRKDGLGEAADIINEFAGRGRKRALDLFITALRYTGSLHRSVFSNKNLTLIGCQEDPTVWSALAPQFKASHIEFEQLNALSPGEFFCFSRRGVDKIRMPMAAALKAAHAPRARPARRALPTTFAQWNRAMREIPDARLAALSEPVTTLLGAVAGVTARQMHEGALALVDERERRV